MSFPCAISRGAFSRLASRTISSSTATTSNTARAICLGQSLRPTGSRSSVSSPLMSREPTYKRNFSAMRTLSAEKRYTEAHEWIELNDSKTEGTVGISVYAANALGDVVYVELPTADLEVNSGDAIGAVESVKSASDIYTPVAGTVIESNAVLEEKPSTINASPEGNGWIAKIKIAEGEADKVAELMNADAYAKFTEE